MPHNLSQLSTATFGSKKESPRPPPPVVSEPSTPCDTFCSSCSSRTSLPLPPSNSRPTNVRSGRVCNRQHTRPRSLTRTKKHDRRTSRQGDVVHPRASRNVVYLLLSRRRKMPHGLLRPSHFVTSSPPTPPFTERRPSYYK